jgi:hypothetical protein
MEFPTPIRKNDTKKIVDGVEEKLSGEQWDGVEDNLPEE